MKLASRVGIGVVMLSALATCTVVHAQSVTPSFTYQGRLTDGGSLANGIYDVEFRLFDAASGGAQVGTVLTANNVGIIDGIVTIELDFGAGVFTGAQRWLEIGVRPGASIGSYTTLSPRQPITAAPYATFALNVPGGPIPSGSVMFFNLASCPSGWSELTAARGRYPVGLQPGGTLAGTVGTALSDLENRPTGQHTHTINDPGHSHGYSAAIPTSTGSGNSKAGYEHQQTDVALTGITINSAGSVAGTNAPYIVLLVCQKN